MEVRAAVTVLWCASVILCVCARPRNRFVDKMAISPQPDSGIADMGKESVVRQDGDSGLENAGAGQGRLQPEVKGREGTNESQPRAEQSVPNSQASLKPTPSTDRPLDDWGTDSDEDGDEKDDCEISKLPCSPFFASPCDRVKPAPVPQYGGHCNMTRTEALKLWTPCGGQRDSRNQSACYCNKQAAVCCAGLSAIPDLSIDNNHTVLYLNFTSNNLTVVDRDLLKNVTQLKWLILNRNNISIVRNDSLESMTRLERFELAYNQFGRKINPFIFTDAMNRVPSLRVLDVNDTDFSKAAATETGITWLIRHLKLPRLKQLYVDGGRKRKFYLSDLDPIRLPELCKFSVKSHFVDKLFCCSARSWNDSLEYDDETQDTDSSEYPYMDHDTHQDTCIAPESRRDPRCLNFTMPNLKLLSLDNNSLVYVPSFCRYDPQKGERVSVVPSLTHLLMAINAVINPKRRQFRCLRSLLFLGLTGNSLKTIENNIFANLPRLQVADLRFTNVMEVEPHAFNHSSLQFVTIKSSNWFVDQHHTSCCISPLLFDHTSLTAVDLSYNVFKYATGNTTNTFLYPLRTVSVLRMAEVGLTRIPWVVRRHFTHLQVLDLKGNQMSRIPEHVFDNMPLLRSLDLSDNHVAWPSDDILRQLIVVRNVHVNLASNPFSCICDMLEFLELYKAHRDTRPSPSALRIPPANVSVQTGMFVGDPYRCQSPRSLYNESLEDVELTVHMCLLTLTQEIIIYVICLLSIFLILLYTLFYKYRWQVRFWLYTMHVRLTRAQATDRVRPPGRPRFNAFVSYCKEDSHFVLTKVLPTLERNSRLPLCIHERDFIPGRYISQNVVERMEESRHVLLVLSNAFLQNDWCRFELFVAQKYGLIHRQIPITTLMLERLRVDLMDAHVITLLQATPGIEWPGRGGTARDVANFWQRLGQTLGSRPRPDRRPRARLSSGSSPPARAGEEGRVRLCSEGAQNGQ